MFARTLPIRFAVISAFFITACNPIPPTPPPTPAPTPPERNPMQLDVYDFASWLARTDVHGDESVGPERYLDALLVMSACMEEAQIEATEQQDLTPGEAAAFQFWMISIWTHTFITGQMEEPTEGADPTYISALETMAAACLQEQ